MSDVIVGSARIDENGKASGGKPGDQTGKEVSTQDWYKHKKGWRVFRAKDPDKAVKMGRAMHAACSNNAIGYDQGDRYDLFKAAAEVDFDLSKVSIKTEVDCSELVRCCAAYAGIMDLPTSGFRTPNMPKHLLATGEFVELVGTKYTEKEDYLGIGDILVTKTQGHTVIVLSNGDKYEGTIEAREYELGERLIQRDDTGPDVKILQEYLLALGFGVGRYGTDGEFGPDTEKALKNFQKANYLEVDGEYGTDTHTVMMVIIETVTNPPAIEKPTYDKLTVFGNNWNIRTGPDTSYDSVGQLFNGDRVNKVDITEWVPIEYNGETRFVFEDAFKER